MRKTLWNFSNFQIIFPVFRFPFTPIPVIAFGFRWNRPNRFIWFPLAPSCQLFLFLFLSKNFFNLRLFIVAPKKQKKILKILWKIRTRSCFRWKTTLLLILFANFFKDCISRHCVKSTTVENLFILYLNLFKNKTAGGVGGKLGEKRNRKSSFNFRSENSTKMRGKTHKWISDSFNLQWNSVKPDNKKNDGRATSLQVNLARRIETS